jgi:AcrR family transcriptional regulator
LIGDAGFAQTTSKQIAARAGVDLASINHHFGNRAGLYQAVLADAHRRLLDAGEVERLVSGGQGAAEKLRSLIGLLLHGGASDLRWPLVVLLREIMAPSTHLVALQQEEVLPKLRLAMPVLAELTGLPQDDPRLWRCLPAVVAPCAMLALAGQTETPLGHLVAAPPEVLADQMFTFVLGGLAAIRDRYAVC